MAGGCALQCLNTIYYSISGIENDKIQPNHIIWELSKIRLPFASESCEIVLRNTEINVCYPILHVIGGYHPETKKKRDHFFINLADIIFPNQIPTFDNVLANCVFLFFFFVICFDLYFYDFLFLFSRTQKKNNIMYPTHKTKNFGNSLFVQNFCII